MRIEERMARIERSHRRLKLLVTALSLVLVAGATLAMTGIGSRAYPVLDSNGVKRAALEVSGPGPGRPGLRFFDENGRERLFVGMDKRKSPVIQFYDVNGKASSYINETGQSKGLAEDAGKKKTKIVWPLPGDSTMNSTVCTNKKGNRKSFHKCPVSWEPRCQDLKDGFPEMMTIRKAKGVGIKPCQHCFPDMWK